MMLAGLDLASVLELLGVGLLAGCLGGMLGVGGGLVMIPAMVIFLGDQHFGPGSLHVYKLAAITTGVVVSVPAAVRHARAKAIIYAMLPAILPAAVVGILAGVYAAGRFFSAEQTHLLRRAFGGFLVVAVAINIYQDWHARRGDSGLSVSCPLPSRRALIGGIVGIPTGLIAGLLGVGGGIWNVPAQHLLFNVRLRYAIATSSFVVVFVSAITAVVQSISVAGMPGLRVSDGWWLALWLAPGAMLGGWWGAALTHRLPTRWLRYAFQGLLAIVGVRLMFG